MCFHKPINSAIATYNFPKVRYFVNVSLNPKCYKSRLYFSRRTLQYKRVERDGFFSPVYSATRGWRTVAPPCPSHTHTPAGSSPDTQGTPPGGRASYMCGGHRTGSGRTADRMTSHAYCNVASAETVFHRNNCSSPSWDKAGKVLGFNRRI